MKRNYAIITSMLMLSLVLIYAQTHALLMSGAANNSDHARALKASVIETLNPLYGRPQLDDPIVPFDRDVPDSTVH